MRLTDEMIQEDDKRFKRQNLLAEFNYCGKEVPKRKSITNDDIRFYAWLCRSAYTLLKEQEQPKCVKEPLLCNNSPMAYKGICPWCNSVITLMYGKFCDMCGKAVKWDEQINQC